MKIGTKKIVTYKVDEIRAKKFYDRIMSEKNPQVKLSQLSDLQQTFVFTNIRINHYGNNFLDANIDGKIVSVIYPE